ncbi:MAG: hypothetical protein WA177_22165 [Xanthobacteraceae bacterium]
MKLCFATAIALFCLTLAPTSGLAVVRSDQSACVGDAQIYCAQYIPDRVRVAHCLMANRQRISPACREAIKHFK